MIVRKSENQSRDQVVEVLRLLFRSAHDSVTLSTSLTSDLLEAVEGDITDCLSRVKSFSICLDSRVDLAAVRTKYPWLFSSPKVHISQAPGPIPHWIMVDKRDLRLEESHPFPAPAGGWHPRSNMTIIDADPQIANAIEQEFRSFASQARVVKP